MKACILRKSINKIKNVRWVKVIISDGVNGVCEQENGIQLMVLNERDDGIQ